LKSEEEAQRDRFRNVGELTSQITHDLRNPLTVIINYANMVKMNNKNNLDKKSIDQLTLIHDEAQKMFRQIEDVLNFVRLPLLKFEEHFLHEVLKEVIETIELSSEIKINLPNKNPKLSCDAKKLETVFVNLIKNAVQAMQNKGEITITTVDSSKDTVIQIIDSGPGIPPEVMSRIFEPLFTTKEEGTGLGLSSCKSIVERHQGTIMVSNNPTTFTITLPKKSIN